MIQIFDSNTLFATSLLKQFVKLKLQWTLNEVRCSASRFREGK